MVEKRWYTDFMMVDVMNGLLSFFGLHFDDSEQRTEILSAMREGFDALLPTTPATFIWGLVTAVAMVSAGLSPAYTMLINVVVYAGSAQLAVLSLLVAHAPLWVVWLTAAMVNVRFVIFSGAIKPYFRHLSLRERLLFGFLNGDINCMLFTHRYRSLDGANPPPANLEQRSFFVGMALTNFVFWQIGIVFGIALASVVPTEWGLQLAAALTLLILIIKMVDNWAGVAGCVVAALTAVYFHDLPNKLWVLVAIVVGVAVALVVERFLPNMPLRRVSDSGRLDDVECET